MGVVWGEDEWLQMQSLGLEKNIICSKDSVDLYNPKTIQSSMGSFTRVNVYYEDLDKEKTLKILDKILKGETPKPGSYRGRINNEPENNRKTLMDLKNA